MSSTRKRTLLKVIILGDSGCAAQLGVAVAWLADATVRTPRATPVFAPVFPRPRVVPRFAPVATP
jgi:hypothetical protein